MSTVTVLRPSFGGTQWKKAFAEAVIGLCPDMNPDSADELSDGEYAGSRHIDPVIAGRRWFARQNDPQADARSSADPASSNG